MKSLIHQVYRNGSAGLSNLLMSVELGVVLSVLTDRTLVLKGNRTPTANVVQYEGKLSNRYKSRITDLVDLGVPWVELDDINEASIVAHDICNMPVWEAVFCQPQNISTDSEDFRAFAKNRKHFIKIDDELSDIPALLFSGGEGNLTLSYYSYFFYLDRAAQIQANAALRRVKPKAPYSEFSDAIVKSLGNFNAAHIRRGDFKVTSGVTTLDRTPAEVIEIFDHHFKRDDTLVILTDEAGDPFFDEIKQTYKNHILIDNHILDELTTEFLELPQHDSIALAYLSQLIAAQSQDFVGTMTSTFSGMIQRMRGNLGKDEPFKFLWDELPPPGSEIKPGSHDIGQEIPMNKGVMIEQTDGPYSWNRFNQRLNPAWMREWPESFLKDDMLNSASFPRELDTPEAIVEPEAIEFAQTNPGEKTIEVNFRGRTVTATCVEDRMHAAMTQLFANMATTESQLVLGEVEVKTDGDHAKLLIDGKVDSRLEPRHRLLRSLHREIARIFILADPELVWLHSACVAGAEGAILIPGVWGRGKSTLSLALCQSGMKFLSDDISPVDPSIQKVLPYPATPQVRVTSKQELTREQVSHLEKVEVILQKSDVATAPSKVAAIVFPDFQNNAKPNLTPLSPAMAAGQILENCISFTHNSDKTIQAMCDLVGSIPAYNLTFSDKAEAVDMIKQAVLAKVPDGPEKAYSAR